MANLFGTDGIRNQVGVYPFTQETLPAVGNALAQWVINKYGTHARILIGHDTRESADWIICTLLSGLLRHPLIIHNAHILPTPAICNLLRTLDYQIGIIISASHNIFSDNGLKIVDSTTGKITEQDELHISHLISESMHTSYNSFGTYAPLHNAGTVYTNALISHFTPNVLCRKKIILDCAHGATSFIAPQVFELLGAEAVAINNEPNGTNINENSGALHLQSLQFAVLENNADIGFAFDGDGDRVIAVSRHGAIVNGDAILALLADHPLYKDQQTIVSTTMANKGLDLHMQSKGKQLVRTAVGDKFVSDYMNAHKLMLGGEQSGHIILHDYLPTGDGIFTALRVCEVALQTNNWDLATFTPFPQVLLNVPVTCKKDLTEPHLAEIIHDYELQLDAGRLVVRYSGTEPLLRIMVEDQEIEHAHLVATSLAAILEKELA